MLRDSGNDPQLLSSALGMLMKWSSLVCGSLFFRGMARSWVGIAVFGGSFVSEYVSPRLSVLSIVGM